MTAPFGAKSHSYVQLAFVVERVHALAPQHLDWWQQEPFSSVLSGDSQRLQQLSIPEDVLTLGSGLKIKYPDKTVAGWMGSRGGGMLFKRNSLSCRDPHGYEPGRL